MWELTVFLCCAAQGALDGLPVLPIALAVEVALVACWPQVARVLVEQQGVVLAFARVWLVIVQAHLLPVLAMLAQWG